MFSVQGTGVPNTIDTQRLVHAEDGLATVTFVLLTTSFPQS